jgi:hypothetical protein
MEYIINHYQDEAAKAITAMNKAMQQYKATHDSDWLLLSLEWEAHAHRYLSMAEYALEFI